MENVNNYVDARGEKVYPFSKTSRMFRGFFIFFLYLTMILIAVHFFSILISKGAGWLSEFITSLNKESTRFIYEQFPNHGYWENNTINFFNMFKIPTVIKITAIISGGSFIYYVITIAFRHNKGEQYPFTDDKESRKIKKKMLKSLDIGFDANEIVGSEKKQKKKLTKAQHMIEQTIKNTSVQIHTRIDEKDKRTYKEYKVKIPQPASLTVRNGVLNRIKDLDAILTGITGGVVAFGKLENEVTRENFIFRGNIEIERKVAKQKKKAKGAKETIASNSESEDSKTEWAFPLELYVDRTEKIESQRELAKQYAEEQKNSIEVFIIGTGIQASLNSLFVGNTSVQYLYKIAWDTKTASKVGNMGEDLENALKVEGIKVALRAGLLEITIPLPKDEDVDYTIPIDVRTMVQSAFGLENK